MKRAGSRFGKVVVQCGVERITQLRVKSRFLQVSHLDKLLFPGTGFRKADVLDYYIRAADGILPHLRDRPLTLKLYLNGVGEPARYVKNAPSYTPGWVQRAPVWRRSGESQIFYLLVNDLPTLVWAANLNNVEMHTVLARAPRLEQPTAMVFDLDPGEPANILDAAQAALWLKEILDGLALKAFVKSSGSKGLHVYVPMNTKVTFERTLAFSKVVAGTLAASHAEKVVTAMAKAARRGKVFIDYSQNSDYKSMASVYSLRAKPDGPFVSMPLAWDALAEALSAGDLDAFRIRPKVALERLAKEGDPFKAVLTMKQTLPALAPSSTTLPTAKKRFRKHPFKAAPRLTDYHKKRDFARTPEPSGDRRGAHPEKARMPLFVIQKHAASHLHYDFRLEMQGVLRSWAVPKGPPLQAGDRRLAMHVEDHPVEYAGFEGIIPKDQYGGGTVMIWDYGTYEDKSGNPAAAFHRGRMHLFLKGKKLNGEWALVRGREELGDSKTPWYLIKIGSSARPISTRRDDQSAVSRRTMKQIASDEASAVWDSNR
jgi:bifunctional non-homologous end joining protein LigD